MNRGVRISLLGIVFCLACAQVWGQTTVPPARITVIRGFVRDLESHAPLEHVVVTLEREDLGYVAQTETDGLGKFTFESPGSHVFIVKAKAPGYEERSQRVELQTKGTDYVSLELKPTRKHDASLPPEGPKAILDAHAGTIPENARKEYVAGQHLFVDSKDVEGSIRHLLKAIKFYPSFSEAYILLGMAYIDDGKPKEAKLALEKGVELDPKSAAGYLSLGMLLNHEKDHVAAEKALRHAAELNPENPQCQYELAKTYWALERWSEAEPHAQKAVAAQPDLAPVHVLLGNIALRKSDPQGALKEFQEYLRLDPQGPMAEGARAMVEKIRKASAVTQ